MDKSPESLPFTEVEALCRLVGVRFEPYDFKGSLERVIKVVRTLLANKRS